MILLTIAIEINIRHSISVGITKTFSFLFSLNISMRKLDEKEPNRKENI
ncbi:hypothetical protein GCM10022292_21720 [Winogradskyella damuponensis]|uniref:Uncharacterized protein n=1 Tax=Winogradskyella damuponensis TaxID=943939 RepID=A0ABP8CW95_9FLAO